jgi:excisionase family DNA binding protein
MPGKTPHKSVGRLLNLHAVASELDCSLDTVDRYLRAGKLAFIRLPSGRRRVAREDLDRAIDEWREESL